jgi:hypothetical protein
MEWKMFTASFTPICENTVQKNAGAAEDIHPWGPTSKTGLRKAELGIGLFILVIGWEDDGNDS